MVKVLDKVFFVFSEFCNLGVSLLDGQVSGFRLCFRGLLCV